MQQGKQPVAEQWFHTKRTVDGQVTGYRPAHWKGWAATAAYGVAAALSLLLPPLATGMTLPGYVAAAVLIALSTGVFLTVMRRHSDASR